MESNIKNNVRMKSTHDIISGIEDYSKKNYQIGIENNFLRVRQYLTLQQHLKNSKFIDISSIIQQFRMIKDSSELKLMRKSAKVCEKVQTVSREYIRSGITELDLAGEIQREITRYGSTFSYFDGYWGRTPFIIASGENLWARSDFPPVLSGVGPCISVPHGPSDRILKSNDIVVVEVATHMMKLYKIGHLCSLGGAGELRLPAVIDGGCTVFIMILDKHQQF